MLVELYSWLYSINYAVFLLTAEGIWLSLLIIVLLVQYQIDWIIDKKEPTRNLLYRWCALKMGLVEKQHSDGAWSYHELDNIYPTPCDMNKLPVFIIITCTTAAVFVFSSVLYLMIHYPILVIGILGYICIIFLLRFVVRINRKLTDHINNAK